MLPISLPEELIWLSELFGIAVSIFFVFYLFSTHNFRISILNKTRDFFFRAYTTQYLGLAQASASNYLSLLEKIYKSAGDQAPFTRANRIFGRSVFFAFLYFIALSAYFDLFFDTRWERTHDVKHVLDWHDEPFSIPLEYFSVYHLAVSNLVALTLPTIVTAITIKWRSRAFSLFAFLAIMLYAANSGNLCPYGSCYSADHHSFLNSIFNFAVHGVYHRPAFAGTVMVFLAFLCLWLTFGSYLSLLGVVTVVAVSDHLYLRPLTEWLSFSWSDYFIFLSGSVENPNSNYMSKGLRNAILLSFVLVNAFVDFLSVNVTIALLRSMKRAKNLKRYVVILGVDIAVAAFLFALIPAAMLLGSIIIEPYFGAVGSSFATAIQSEISRMLELSSEKRVIWLYLMFASALIPSLIHLMVLVIHFIAALFEPLIRRFVYAGDYLISPGEEYYFLGVKISRFDRLFLVISLSLAGVIWLFL